MAVRDDFSAGEVLAAADLNDTFASKLPYSYGTATPTTSTDGFLWYDENSTPPTPKFWDGAAFQNVAPAGGLELITAESFSAVSSVSLNGCFTSAYQNYLLTCKLETASAANALVNFRLRASGSDETGSSYNTQRIRHHNTGVAGAVNPSANTLWTVATVDTSWQKISAFKLEVFAPQESTNTLGIGHAANLTAGENRQEIYAHNIQNTTSYDGFSLLVASGTFGGTIRVYGYKD